MAKSSGIGEFLKRKHRNSKFGKYNNTAKNEEPENNNFSKKFSLNQNHYNYSMMTPVKEQRKQMTALDKGQRKQLQ